MFNHPKVKSQHIKHSIDRYEDIETRLASPEARLALEVYEMPEEEFVGFQESLSDYIRDKGFAGADFIIVKEEGILVELPKRP